MLYPLSYEGGGSFVLVRRYLGVFVVDRERLLVRG